MKEFLTQQLWPCNTWLCMPLASRAPEQWLEQCWTPSSGRESLRILLQTEPARLQSILILESLLLVEERTKTQRTQTLQCLSQALKPQGCPAGGHQPPRAQCPAGHAAHGPTGGPSSREALRLSCQRSSQADSKLVQLDCKSCWDSFWFGNDSSVPFRYSREKKKKSWICSHLRKTLCFPSDPFSVTQGCQVYPGACLHFALWLQQSWIP